MAAEKPRHALAILNQLLSDAISHALDDPLQGRLLPAAPAVTGLGTKWMHPHHSLQSIPYELGPCCQLLRLRDASSSVEPLIYGEP